jgi:hypothetical protein
VSKVILRRKKIGKGRIALYLDIYPPVPNPDTGAMTRKNYLRIYVYEKPRTELDRLHNKETMELAETIRSRRQLEVQNKRFGFLSARMMNGDLLSSLNHKKKCETGLIWKTGEWLSVILKVLPETRSCFPS